MARDRKHAHHFLLYPEESAELETLHDALFRREGSKAPKSKRALIIRLIKEAYEEMFKDTDNNNSDNT